MSRLLLGPIVGHTDHESTRIWIRVRGDPADFTLRISGVARPFRFRSTEGDREFGTTVAVATGLRPEWEYKYRVLYRGRTLLHSRGTFRTMPSPGSMADMLFVTVSCSHNQEIGAWRRLRDYIREAKPRFLLMIGDQVYQEDSIDESDPGGPDGAKRTIWNRHLDGGYSQASDRRRAMVETYQRSWSREPIREVLANIPVYMMWDDHDIRDGWGSWASESPALFERYPRGAGIFRLYNEWFEDARDVFWHFQRSFYYPLSEEVSTAIPTSADELPPRGLFRAMPIAFQCGRLAILILDSRGERDLWRERYPILGEEQWGFIDDYVSNLSSDIDALAIVTTVPIVAMAPDNGSQKMLGNRNDDVEYFRRGDFARIRELEDKRGPDLKTVVIFTGIAMGLLTGGRFRDSIAAVGKSVNWKLTSIDDARDQWCNHFSQPEQEKVIRKAGEARLSNRLPSRPRDVFFLGGDLHSGGLFSISVDRPAFTVPCLITSGISQQNNSGDAMVGVLVDDAFDVAPGIHAKLEDYTVIYNFGVTHILFSGGTPVIKNIVARQGDDSYWTIKLT